MALLPQFVKQYDGSSRAQFIAQYFDDSNVTTGQPFDFDSAIGTIGTIANASSLTPHVEILPDLAQTDIEFGWLNTYVRVRGVNGKTPTFEIDFSDWRTVDEIPAGSDWEMVWRYRDDSDPGTLLPRAWSKFDNGSGTVLHTFSNNSAFTQEDVEISIKPRFTYLDMQRAIAYAAASPYYSQLSSANSSNVFATTTLTGSPTNGTTATTLNQYGLLLDDTSVSPASGDKLNVIVLLSQHPCEDQGDFAGWKFIQQYLDGAGTLYDWLRQHTRLHIYNVNPAGKYYGRERYTEEDGTDHDPNRVWSNSNSEQVTAVKTAIGTDVSRVDIVLDYHGSFRLNGNGRTEPFGAYFYNNTAATDFVTRFAAASAYSFNDLGDAASGWAAYYAGLDLGAQLAIVAEFPVSWPDGFPAYSALDDVTDDYIEALQAMVNNSELTLYTGIVEAALTGSLSMTVAFDGSAQAEASLDLAFSVSAAMAAQVSGEATFTVNQTLGDSTVGQAQAASEVEGAVTFNAALSAIATADAAALSTLTSAIEAAGNMTAIVAIPSAISAGAQAGMTTTSFVGIGSNVSAGILAGAQASGEAQAYAAIAVDQALGANLIVEAMAEAGLSVSSVQNVTFVGASISGDAVTPDGRRFRVALDLRTFEVSLETRSFKADQE